MEGKTDGTQRIRVSFTARRVRIDPRKKREEYIHRLERVMSECDMIVSDPEGYEDLQVKAMAVLIRAIQCATSTLDRTRGLKARGLETPEY